MSATNPGDVRAQVDALAAQINALKKQKGKEEEVAVLVKQMIELRKQLQPSSKPAKEVEPSYFDQRVAMVREMGMKAYPHKFDVDITRISVLCDDQERDKYVDKFVNVVGRIVSKRSSGSRLHFLTLQGDGKTIQIVSSAERFNINGKESQEEKFANFSRMHQLVKRGDIVGVQGQCGYSKTGEFSVFTTDLILLSPCYHMIPEGWYGFSNMEQRYRQRYLDFIVNPQNMDVFRKRADIITHVRNFFLMNGFTEVETPVLNSLAGGAAARPFTTHHYELDQTMYLRIAPELALKMLVVGGMDRVFEIGRQFRNEGMDLTHNPEFTSIEAYWAYKDYNDLMSMTEELLESLAKVIHKSADVLFDPRDVEGKSTGSALIFNFRAPFKKLRIIPELTKRMGVEFPEEFDSDKANVWLLEQCNIRGIECHPPTTTPRLFDALISHYLEPECTQPTFLIDHPRIMSPLAKWHREDPRLSERFELFVNKKELCNAYTELNSPLVQREEFEKQARDKAKGDLEAMPVDEVFLRALEHGLPPTAGWGMGIDRLVMFMTSNVSIREVLLFPAMRAEGTAAPKTVARLSGAPLNGQGVPRLRTNF